MGSNMSGRLRLVPLSPRWPLAAAAAFAVLLAGCESRDRVARPPVVQTAPPAAGPGLDPVYGEWETDKATPLRARPSDAAAIVASLAPGQPVKVMGRARGTSWIAVQAAGSTAYVPLHLLRLRGSEPRTAKGTTTTLAKPADNAGPSIKAAPRRKIESVPIASQ